MKLTIKKSIAALTLVLVMMPVFVLAQNTGQVQIPNPGGLPGTALGAGDATIQSTIFQIINIALGIAGLIALLFLIIGGFRYVTAGGNEDATETAKKIILNAIIGIIIIILSYVILQVVRNAVVGNV